MSFLGKIKGLVAGVTRKLKMGGRRRKAIVKAGAKKTRKGGRSRKH
jgi:hypothetical protein